MLGLPLFRAELGHGWALRQVHTDRKRTVLTPSVQIREKRQHRAVVTLGQGQSSLGPPKQYAAGGDRSPPRTSLTHGGLGRGMDFRVGLNPVSLVP